MGQKLLFLFFIIISFFNWSMFALQLCFDFCHTRCQSTIYVHIPLHAEPPSHQPPPLRVVTIHQDKLPVLHSNYALTMHFTRGHVCISMLLSQFVPPSPSSAESTSPFSTSGSVFLS